MRTGLRSAKRAVFTVIGSVGFLLVGILPAAANTITPDTCHNHNSDSSISCAGANVWCGNTCRAPLAPTGTQDVNCSSCVVFCAPATPCGPVSACTAPTSSPSGTVSCSGNASCPANGGVYTDQCSSSFGCPSGKTLCSSPLSCATTLSCSPGFTFNACANGGTGACESPYVVLNPPGMQTGNIFVNGDFNLGDAKNFYVNGAAATSLKFRNAGAGGRLNIGIGEPSPIAQLDVSESASSGWLIMRLNQNNTTRLYTGLRLDREGAEKWFVGLSDMDNKLRFRFNGASDAMVIDNTGNVGINTPNPGSILHVSGAGSPEVRITSTTSGGRTFALASEGDESASPGFSIIDRAVNVRRFSINPAGQTKIGPVISGTTPSSANVALEVTDDTNSPVMTVWYQTAPGVPAKRVGIGTTSPATTLHANGIVTSTPFGGSDARRVELTTPGASDGGIILRDSTTDLTNRIDISRYGSRLGFFFGNGATTLEKVTFLNSGNVGVGITAPGYKLDLRETAGAGSTAILRVNQDNATKLYAGMRLDRQTVEKWFMGMNGTDDKLRLRRTGSADAVVIDETNGNVNINGGGLSTNAADATTPAGTVETAKLCLGNASTGAEAICKTAWPQGVDSYDPTICFGPVYVGDTVTSYSGNVGSSGGVSGYRRANELCATALGAGAHVCSIAEMLSSIKCSAPALLAEADGQTFWINGGPPGYTAAAKDCEGWTSSFADPPLPHYGRFWLTNATTGGVGSLTTCNASIPFACCK